MAQRIIPCRVIDDYITGDGVTIGGAGSHNEVLLELDFRADDTPWKGTTRTVTFTDATGETYVNVLLTADLLKKDRYGDPVDPEVYLCPVPYDVKQYPGWITVTVTGVQIADAPTAAGTPVPVTKGTDMSDGTKTYLYTGTTTATLIQFHWYKNTAEAGQTPVWTDQGVYRGEILRIATGAARFRVLPDDLVRWLEDPRAVPWPPASVTEQLQAEIDEIKSLIRTQWVYLFVSDGTDGRENGVMYAQVYTGQPHSFVLTEDGHLEVQYE